MAGCRLGWNGWHTACFGLSMLLAGYRGRFSCDAGGVWNAFVYPVVWSYRTFALFARHSVFVVNYTSCPGD